MPDPVNPQDVATKEYADNVRGDEWVKRKQDGTFTIKRDLDMNNKRLKNVPPPVEDANTVNIIYADTLSDETKRYVDSVTPFVNQQYGYVATNNIIKGHFTLQNVGEPTNAKDVATKAYVDNSGGGAFEARNRGYTNEGDLYIKGYKIGGVRQPTKDGDKRKVCGGLRRKFKKTKTAFSFHLRNLIWRVTKLSSLSIPSKSDEAATKEDADKVGNDVREYLDQSSEILGKRFHNLSFAFLRDNGNFVANTPISMVSQPVIDLPEPKKTSDAVPKKYVNDLIADNVGVGNMNGGGSPFFKKNGNYQATHAINMMFKKLLNLSTPSEMYEAAIRRSMWIKDHILSRYTRIIAVIYVQVNISLLLGEVS